MSKRRIWVGLLSVVSLALVALVVHYVQQANSWPSLDDESPLVVPEAVAPTASWRALENLMSTFPKEHSDRIQEAIQEEGMSALRGIWMEASTSIDGLSSVLESSRIVSPTRKPGSKDSQISLIPLLTLAEAQILRGWDRYGEGDSLEAVEDLLQADRLGQLLVDGSQSLMASMIGYSIQAVALRELQELLSLVHQPAVHRMVSQRLHQQAPEKASFEAMLLRECANTEEFLRDPLEGAAGPVREGWLEKGLPGVLYDLDATVAQHRHWCHAARAWIAVLPAQRPPPPVYVPEGLSKVLTYNRIGIQLLTVLSIEGGLRMLESVHEHLLQREALRLLTAVRLYGFAKAGKLPERPEVLVPEYLASVPLDPFTGKALEMTSEQIVVSQGEPK